MKPWKRRTPGNAPGAVLSFNGATAMKPWKRAVSVDTNDLPNGLQWGHGDEAVEETAAPIVSHRDCLLQWGHGDEAVEEGHKFKCLVDNYLASMGPRR